ncbi:MAG: nickel-dependent hydrogenase large subunit [Candidatus Bathyarchaeia archaeon]|nr:nickel-dependent hydrogenase large subunit [Candidatus Bathyarchaeota archaeon]
MVTEKHGETKDVEVDYARLRIPFGPVHPALKEPVSLRVTVRKEEIVDVDIVLGHVHRGIEGLAENRNLVQTLYLVERVCGICSHSHTTCYVQALEEIGEIKPPERALYLRTLIFELERIHSHLFLLGVLAYEIGFDTLFMFTWHVRESILDLFEKITGNRVHHSMNTLGGVRWDVDQSMVEEIMSTMKNLHKYVQQIHDSFQDKSVEKRLCDVGFLAKDEAIRLCVVGPTARGSGVDMDVRRDHPYAAYNDLREDFSVVVKEKGDVYARTEVRILELFESINIIQKILAKLPGGNIRVEDNIIKLMRRIPQGEAISLVEAPRGELLYFVKTNVKGGLSRLKIRTPTIPNVLGLKPMLVGCEIADIPVIIASVDPCMACANRITVVDAVTGEEETMDTSVLRRKR